MRSAVAEAVAPLREAAPRLRWVAPDRYHLTLVFLGEVAGERVGAVAAALDAVGARLGPFELALSGEFGTFGRRVLWAGLEESEPLRLLALRVGQALRPVVAPPDGERTFSAHLTLARSGREPVRRDLVGQFTVPALRWPVERVVLMRSAGGYTVEHAVALRAEDA